MTVTENSYKGYCICPKCGGEANVDIRTMLTSCPPKYSYKCPHCGETGYIFCKDAYFKG